MKPNISLANDPSLQPHNASPPEPARVERVYVVPQRCVRTPDDMAAWERSTAYHGLINFINAVSQAVQGHRNTDPAVPLSAQTERLLELLDALDAVVEQTPPIDQPQRFGNKAFRDCYAKIRDQALPLLQAALPERLQRAAVECATYLAESFGNAIRIDYGTGHELAFVMFLCCLYKVYSNCARVMHHRLYRNRYYRLYGNFHGR